MGEGRGWLGRRFHRLTADNQELEDEELRQASVAVGADPMHACRDREEACVAGSIRSVTVRARSGAPSLEVDLYDGSGTVTLVFLGRKHIAGIEAGRSVKASGRVVVRDERTTMFNPRYELLPASSTSA
ncbi:MULTISPECIES: OB-fold nucleic acid binding domain-containing protein [Frankiaceae]|uniref:DNA-binding protein n=1 Tax=Parafrankia soli TaxID=2599596 RepID=A0A1S1QUM0_9ACTN|nr:MULTISPECIES: OB-fold nucleic acid binding domain-containing protein [Frankiaceae]OHV37306.1 DNA-binding protein [Parafrankia soli]TCJ36152.1 DNA-binding protein [Parafrankia sp. BMG5.11]CAI7977849.1 Nucleic acid binding OB-fold tRNA/helicase-type [Frankia sp. Hr75.2]SQD98817.1 Nucleic acid binding OB-fold tRNA/helicase-type [Parafrankia sp. Ea1.12]